MPMISKWKFGVYIQTFMYQPEGSNFKPYPFFNWTQDKGSCITCKKEIRQKSFADHRLYIYARSIKRSKRPIIISPWKLSPKQISFISRFTRLSMRLQSPWPHICALWIKNYYINTQHCLKYTPVTLELSVINNRKGFFLEKYTPLQFS